MGWEVARKGVPTPASNALVAPLAGAIAFF